MPRRNYKEDIVKSAKELLSKYGYDHINMRKIAQGAGIKAASIYNHFKNKDEIYYTLILDGRLLLAKRIREYIDQYDDVESKLKAYVDAYLDFGFENPEYYRIMFMQSYPEKAMAPVKDKIAREIEPGLNTLAQFLQEYTGLGAKEAMNLGEAFFHILHGHVSLSILNRADFLFDVEAAGNKIREIIRVYLSSIKK
ncbi:MAG: TetR/AcrR family transcriptional regulator [Candidatus Kapaibacterium sp.]